MIGGLSRTGCHGCRLTSWAIVCSQRHSPFAWIGALRSWSIVSRRGAFLILHVTVFRIDLHNPSTINNVSAYTTGPRIITDPETKQPETIPKDVRLPAALRKIFLPSQAYVSARQILMYSSHSI
jgi:hypothetical protein